MIPTRQRDFRGRPASVRRLLGGVTGRLAFAALLGLPLVSVQRPWISRLADGPTASDQAPEYQVKAAFLYNFVRYTSWPEDAFADDTSPFVVAVVGPNPFGDYLETTFKGKKVEDRPFVIRHHRELPEAIDAHLAFTTGGKDIREQLLTRTKEHPVLVVGEQDGYAREGAQVGFFKEDRKVRFEINVASVKRSKLKMSSQLLKLARLVEEDTRP